MSFLWFADIHEQVANYMNATFMTLGKSKSEIINLSEIILPFYQDAILKEGFPVFQLGDPESVITLNHVAESTNIDRNFINQYLASLERAAKQGVIDYMHWNPFTEGIKAETETKDTTDTTGLVEILPGLSLPAPQIDIAKGIDKQITKIVVSASIVLGVFLISREIIKKF